MLMNRCNSKRIAFEKMHHEIFNGIKFQVGANITS